MAFVAPPPQVKMIRRKHMDLVEEHRILNGHYKRLMTVKAAIDTHTPRSMYTNPRRKSRKNLSSPTVLTINRSPSPSRVGIGERSRSAASSNYYTINSNHNENTVAISSALSSPQPNVFVASASPLRLHRASNRNQQQGRIKTPLQFPVRRSTSTSDLRLAGQSPLMSKRHVQPTPSIGLNSLWPYNREHSASSLYERRHLTNGDLLEKDFHMFNQPTRSFQPRFLLFNTQRSKIATQRKHYQPPMPSKQLSEIAPGIFLVEQESSNSQQNIQRQSSGEKLFSSTNANFRLVSMGEKFSMSDNRKMLLLRSQSQNRLRFTSGEQQEFWTWSFMNEVTKDIISAQSCSETVLFRIFAQATKRWRDRLSLPTIRKLLAKLLDDIQAPRDGILCIYAEDPTTDYVNSQGPLQKDAAIQWSASLDKGDGEKEPTKYENDEYELSESVEEYNDIENIIKSKNLKDLSERLNHKQRRFQKHDHENRKRTPSLSESVVEEIKSNHSSVGEAASMKETSIPNKQKKTGNKVKELISSNSSTSPFSEGDFREKSDANQVEEKRKITNRLPSSDFEDSDNETAAHISDLDEDETEQVRQRVLSLLLTENKQKHESPPNKPFSSDPDNHISNVLIKQISAKGQSPTEDEDKSEESEFRLDTMPPRKWTSETENASSSRRSSTGKRFSPENNRPLSREGSLSSDHDEKPEKIEQQQYKDDKSITNHQNNDSTVPDAMHIPNERIYSPTSQEVRHRREEFLKKIEADKLRQSISGDKNEPNDSITLSNFLPESPKSAIVKNRTDDDGPQHVLNSSFIDKSVPGVELDNNDIVTVSNILPESSESVVIITDNDPGDPPQQRDDTNLLPDKSAQVDDILPVDNQNLKIEDPYFDKNESIENVELHNENLDIQKHITKSESDDRQENALDAKDDVDAQLLFTPDITPSPPKPKPRLSLTRSSLNSEIEALIKNNERVKSATVPETNLIAELEKANGASANDAFHENNELIESEPLANKMIEVEPQRIEDGTDHILSDQLRGTELDVSHMNQNGSPTNHNEQLAA